MNTTSVSFPDFPSASIASCVLAAACVPGLSLAAQGIGFPSIDEVLRAAQRSGTHSSATSAMPAASGPTRDAAMPASTGALRKNTANPPVPAHTPALASPLGAGSAGERLKAMLRQHGVSYEPPAALLHGKLYVAISFSMPEASLKKILRQAKAAGATVILRGLSGTAKATQERLSQMLPSQQGAPVASTAQLPPLIMRTSPRAYERFAITEVPAFVLVPPGAARDDCETPACREYGNFAMVTGDVSLGYAMSAIGRAKPELREAAEFFSRQSAAGLSREASR